jgi:hypothetical protein
MKNKPTFKKFTSWLSSELNKGNFSLEECEAMNQDFAKMSETRLKKLANNFNL